jgi:hypothetical protein
MKKILLISLFCLGLMPHFQNGHFSFKSENIFGQNWGVEVTQNTSGSCVDKYNFITQNAAKDLKEDLEDCAKESGVGAAIGAGVGFVFGGGWGALPGAGVGAAVDDYFCRQNEMKEYDRLCRDAEYELKNCKP